MVVAAAAFGDQLAYAVEISHTNRKVAGKSDYIYLITQSETVQLRWCAAFPSRPAGPWIPVHWTWLTVRLVIELHQVPRAPQDLRAVREHCRKAAEQGTCACARCVCRALCASCVRRVCVIC